MRLFALAFIGLLACTAFSVAEEVDKRWNSSSGSSCSDSKFLLQSCNNQLACDSNYYSSGSYYDVVPYARFDSPDSVPSNPDYTLRYEMSNIYGKHRRGKYAAFQVWLRAVQSRSYLTAKFYYDWNGKGTWDRTETYDITPVKEGSWNKWYQSAMKLRARSGSEYRDFNNGRFKVVFWQPYASYGGNYGGHDGGYDGGYNNGGYNNGGYNNPYDDGHRGGNNNGGGYGHGGNQGGNNNGGGYGHGGNQGGNNNGHGHGGNQGGNNNGHGHGGNQGGNNNGHGHGGNNNGGGYGHGGNNGGYGNGGNNGGYGNGGNNGGYGHGGNNGGHDGGYGGDHQNYGQVWVLTDRPRSGYYSNVVLPYSDLSYNKKQCSSNYPHPYNDKH